MKRQLAHLGAGGSPRPLRLSDDPAAAFRLRILRDRRQVLKLAARLHNQNAWPQVAGSLAELEGLAHGLAGASGVFGYPALGDAAARVERLAERWRLAAPPVLSPRRKSLLAGAVRSLIEQLQLREDGA